MDTDNPNTIDLELLPKVIYSTTPAESKTFISDLKVNLEKFVLESDSVFVIGHNVADLDSIGSAATFAYVSEWLRKKEKDSTFDKNPESVYVVVNDWQSKLQSSVKKLMHDKCSSIRFINKYDCLRLLGDNDFLLVTDVNQSSRIALSDDLHRFRHVMVVDHHDVNAGTMHADKFFIDKTKSSASEIAYRVLASFGISCPKDIATAVLAGINQDTDNYEQKRTPALLSLIAKLMNIDKNADAYVTQILRSNFYTDMEIYDIILKCMHSGKLFLYEMTRTDSLPEVDSDESIQVNSTVAFLLNDKKSDKITLSKIANALRKYADVSFAIGQIDEDDKVSIHVRSNGNIDGGKIMEPFGGGGAIEMASAQVDQETPLEDVKSKVLSLLPPTRLVERTVK